MHSLSGSSAAVCGNHGSVFSFVELNAKVVQPFDRVRGFHYQSLYQLWLCSKVSAAEAVQVMLYRGVVFFVCCLDSAFCHHGVGVTDTKLGNDHNVCACIVCFDGTGGSCSAAADYKDIYVIIDFVKINFFVHQTAFRMKHFC